MPFGQHDEDRQMTRPAEEFEVNDQAVNDTGHRFDHAVVLGSADPDTVSVDGGVGSPEHDPAGCASTRNEFQPIAVPPDWPPGVVGEVREVACDVATVTYVIPEAQWHGRQRTLADQLADLIDDRSTVRVVHAYRRPKGTTLQLAGVDGQRR